MRNKEIEKLLREQKIYKYQIAKKLGIHETSFIRWFREELTENQIQQVLSAIEEIKLERLKEQK